MWNSIEDDTKLLSLSKFTKKMKTGFPAKLLTAKYKFIPCMFQSYIFVFLCAFLYCLLVVSFMCVCLCVCVFFFAMCDDEIRQMFIAFDTKIIMSRFHHSRHC